jgi:hypothetical protein
LFATLLAPPAYAHHDHHCRALDGPFSSVLVPPPQCTSAVGLCTHGVLTGDLEASYDFTADTLAPANDPDHPGRLLYTGTSVITPSSGAARGQLFSDDTGFLDPDPTGTAYFATTVHVIRGTKRFKRTTGTLVATGTLNFATGEASGTYTGEFCKTDDDDDHDDE